MVSDPERVVKNLSKITLTLQENQVVLNYAIAPARIPIDDIIAATEATARKLDHKTANHLRLGVSHILRRTAPPPSNLDRGMRQALRSLKQDRHIVILPADKGNTTVVMNRPEYNSKMLQDKNTYRHSRS